jgi:hypothetical protein
VHHFAQRLKDVPEVQLVGLPLDARAKAAAEGGTTPSKLMPWNVHDLRRTVATGLQRLGIRLEVTEAV